MKRPSYTPRPASPRHETIRVRVTATERAELRRSVPRGQLSDLARQLLLDHVRGVACDELAVAAPLLAKR